MFRLCPCLLMFVMTASSACQFEKPAKNPFTYEAADMNYFSQFVNGQGGPQDTVTLVNHGYPLELTLKGDQTFHYLLENLGDGQGVWKYSENYLFLYAERDMFVMKFYVHKAAGLREPVVEFADRFGPKYLELEQKL